MIYQQSVILRTYKFSTLTLSLPWNSRGAVQIHKNAVKINDFVYIKHYHSVTLHISQRYQLDTTNTKTLTAKRIWPLNLARFNL